MVLLVHRLKGDIHTYTPVLYTLFSWTYSKYIFIHILCWRQTHKYSCTYGQIKEENTIKSIPFEYYVDCCCFYVYCSFYFFYYFALHLPCIYGACVAVAFSLYFTFFLKVFIIILHADQANSRLTSTATIEYFSLQHGNDKYENDSECESVYAWENVYDKSIGSDRDNINDASNRLNQAHNLYKRLLSNIHIEMYQFISISAVASCQFFSSLCKFEHIVLNKFLCKITICTPRCWCYEAPSTSGYFKHSTKIQTSRRPFIELFRYINSNSLIPFLIDFDPLELWL